MPSLLLFAPQTARRDALAEQLSRWPGLELTTARTLAEFKAALANKPDALLLDPADSEFDAEPCRNFRALRLGVGGDIATPVRWSQLASRLQLLLGRGEAEEEFAVGHFVCLPLERVLLDAEGDEHTKLTDKEVHLLRMLAESGSTGMQRDELLERVWGYREGLDTHTLETHIYRLRQKIEADPAVPTLLLTIDGGYALAGAG